MRQDVIGLDRLPSAFTDHVGSINDATLLRALLPGVDVVLHAATLHKPHVATHTKADFVDVNISGTLALLEAAAQAGVHNFIYSSTTSSFGRALRAGPEQPTGWITEQTRPLARNIYGVSKLAAEDLCELFHLEHGMNCVVLKVARFFPEEDDDADLRAAYSQENLKVNEFLYRRLDIEDAAMAHLCAAERADSIGFGRYIISSTSPFRQEHLPRLRDDAAAVVAELFPDQPALYAQRGWTMLPGLDRVYVNDLARSELGWTPRYDFRFVLDRLSSGLSPTSPLAKAIGSKGYHRLPA